MARKVTFTIADEVDDARRDFTQRHPDVNWSAIVSSSLGSYILGANLLEKEEQDIMNTIMNRADLDRLAHEKRALELNILKRGFADGLRWAAKDASWTALESVTDLEIPNQASVDDVWGLARRIARSADPLDEGQEWFGDEREVYVFWGDRFGEFCTDGDVPGLLNELGVDYLRSFIRGTQSVYNRVTHAAA